jgi:hypothetical protein
MFSIEGPEVRGGMSPRELQRGVRAASLSGLSESDGQGGKCDAVSRASVRDS